MGSKRLPPDQENHLRLKNFFIRESMEPKLFKAQPS